MKKFKFSLETVLQVRHRNEEIKKREYSESMNAARAAAEELEQTGQRVQAMTDAIKHDRAEQSDPRATLAALRFKGHLERVMGRQRQQLATAAVAAENKRVALVEAARQRKVIDRLREKKYELFLHEAETEEQKRLDEVAGMMARRRTDVEVLS